MSDPGESAVQARHWRKFHACAMVVWLLLGIPTVLIWSESVLWVLIISLYANIVGHFGAWQAARAEDVGATNPEPES